MNKSPLRIMSADDNGTIIRRTNLKGSDKYYKLDDMMYYKIESKSKSKEILKYDSPQYIRSQNIESLTPKQMKKLEKELEKQREKIKKQKEKDKKEMHRKVKLMQKGSKAPPITEASIEAYVLQVKKDKNKKLSETNKALSLVKDLGELPRTESKVILDPPFAVRKLQWDNHNDRYDYLGNRKCPKKPAGQPLFSVGQPIFSASTEIVENEPSIYVEEYEEFIIPDKNPEIYESLQNGQYYLDCLEVLEKNLKFRLEPFKNVGVADRAAIDDVKGRIDMMVGNLKNKCYDNLEEKCVENSEAFNELAADWKNLLGEVTSMVVILKPMKPSFFEKCLRFFKK